MNQNKNEQEDLTLVDFTVKPAPVEMGNSSTLWT